MYPLLELIKFNRMLGKYQLIMGTYLPGYSCAIDAISYMVITPQKIYTCNNELTFKQHNKHFRKHWYIANVWGGNHDSPHTGILYIIPFWFGPCNQNGFFKRKLLWKNISALKDGKERVTLDWHFQCFPPPSWVLFHFKQLLSFWYKTWRLPFM